MAATNLFYEHRIALLVSVILIAAAALGISAAAGFSRTREAASQIHPIWLAALVGSQAVAYAGYALAYGLLFKFKPGAALHRTLSGFSPFVFRSGFAYDSEALGGPRGIVSKLLLWEYVGLLPLAYAAAAIALLPGSSVPKSFSVPWVVGVPAGIVLAALAVKFRNKITRQSRKLKHILRTVSQFFAGLARPESVYIWLSLMIYWAGEVAAVWVALRLFGMSFSVVAITVGYATGYILSRRSLPLAGAGVVITFLTFALYFVGIPLNGALVAIFSYYFFNLLLPWLIILAAGLSGHAAFRSAGHGLVS